jgi:3-deoxy-D-manno-octulosonic acid kinase
MTGFDANEHLTPFRDDRGYGAILFDRTQVRQPDPHWFDAQHWGAAAQRVGDGGRGGAWFLALGEDKGEAFLRHYLRGGLAAKLSRDAHLWRGIQHVRSFEEFRLLRQLRAKNLPVPLPFAACYRREGLHYRAAILMQRLQGVQSLAALADAGAAPWAGAGELVARFHRAGLDHADLNAHNILFDAQGQGWMIDVDRSHLRIPATGWREANLQRLHRSLRKLGGGRGLQQVDADVAVLRAAYQKAWDRGF